MASDPTHSVAEARLQVDRKHELIRQQIATKEEYDRQAYRLKTFEVQLAMIQQELDELEGAGLKSMLVGMFKDKQAVIEQKRAAIAAAEEDTRTCESTAEDLRVRLEELACGIAELADCEHVYKQRLDARAEELAASSSEAGEQYRALHGSGDAVRSQIRNMGKAIELGEYLKSALSTARLSTRRASSKKMIGGAVTGGLYNSILNQATKVSADGANNSLCNFKQALENVVGDLSGSVGPEEQQLLESIQSFQQHSAILEMDESCAEALAMDSTVAELTNQIHELVKEREKELDAIEQHRCALIEQASD